MRKEGISCYKNTGEKAVLVLDRATYHTVLDEEDKRPAQSMNISPLSFAIRRWGGAPRDWNADWEKSKTKSQLLEYARKLYTNPKYKYRRLQINSQMVNLRSNNIPTCGTPGIESYRARLELYKEVCFFKEPEFSFIRGRKINERKKRRNYCVINRKVHKACYE